MDTKIEKYSQMAKAIVDSLQKAHNDAKKLLKYSDLFDSFGVGFTKYVSPYLWISPLIVIIVVLVTFKRAKLFGSTQKILIFAMTLDMSFTVFTGIKDGVLNFLDMNYGFVEYKVCRFLLISFGVQGVIHGSSLLLKSVMMLRIVLLFAYPMKYRQFRIRKWVVIVSFLHVLVCAFSISFVVMMSIIPVRTVQEYNHGKPLKIIEACEIISDGDDSFLHMLNAYPGIMIAVRVYYFILIPLILHCVCIVVLAVLLRKQINAVKKLVADKQQRLVIKYLRLMKVSLLLGISFLIQEFPQAISQLYMYLANIHSLSKSMNSLSYIMMSISFAFGKPMDLLIYASQSKAFRSSLSKWICWKNKH
jgi:hypothetical protein